MLNLLAYILVEILAAKRTKFIIDLCLVQLLAGKKYCSHTSNHLQLCLNTKQKNNASSIYSGA